MIDDDRGRGEEIVALDPRAPAPGGGQHTAYYVRLETKECPRRRPIHWIRIIPAIGILAAAAAIVVVGWALLVILIGAFR